MFAVSSVRVQLVFFLGILVQNFINCAWWDEPDDQARIFNADAFAKIQDYPFMVSIVLTSPDNVPDQFICGGFNFHGTYNHQGIVFTSGNCVNNLIKSKVNPSFIRIRSNSEYWDCGCGISREYSILNWNVHPDYQEHAVPFVGTFFENDIGIIQISGTFAGEYDDEYSLDINIRGKTFRTASILGWGYTKLSDAVSRRLRVSKGFLVISGDDCRDKYYKEYFPKKAFCILAPGNFQGPCAFDQGGAVFAESSGENYLLGIISTSVGCGKNSKPTIVVKTNEYREFLNNLSWVIPSKPSKKQKNQYLYPKTGGGFQWWKPVGEI